MKRAMLNHRNTTIAGISMIVVAISQMALAIFDGDPGSTPDFNLVVAEVVAGFGLICSADGDRS